jgi:hypothetical protein
MPKLVVGNTELVGSKLKICNVFPKPNSEPEPNLAGGHWAYTEENLR